jgi:glucans biosynthesis protein C
MMLLGIYLHAVLGYSPQGAKDWPYIDPHPTAALDITLGLVHVFRMPAFYVLAGFFGALIWSRRGATQFFRNRALRIALPFIVFWPPLFAATFTLSVWGRRGVAAVGPAWASGSWMALSHPMHLWFLQYLAILYAAGGAVCWAARRVPAPWRARVRTAFTWAFTRSYAPAIPAVLSWIPLAQMNGELTLNSRWVPAPALLAVYTVPFVLGWLLHGVRELLPRFERLRGVYLAVACAGFVVYAAAPGETHPVLRAAGNATACWFAIFSVTGTFLRHARHPSQLGRYLSDASYWMYLVHVPVVIALQFALRDLPWSPFAKIPIVLGATATILVVSYDLLVRPTWIGVMLNGTRQPRGLPPSAEALATLEPRTGVAG